VPRRGGNTPIKLVAAEEAPVPQLTKEELLQFAQDLRNGLSDEGLKEKYGLSDRTLVVHRMAVEGRRKQPKADDARPTRKVSALELVSDVRSGMDESAMMQKYSLTSRELQKLFRKIISAGLMSAQELADRLKITESQLTEVFAMAAGIARGTKDNHEK
jgi:hypothetical protein